MILTREEEWNSDQGNTKVALQQENIQQLPGCNNHIYLAGDVCLNTAEMLFFQKCKCQRLYLQVFIAVKMWCSECVTRSQW